MNFTTLGNGGIDHARWLSAGAAARQPAGNSAGGNLATLAGAGQTRAGNQNAASGSADARTAETARQFESMLLRQLMQTMRSTSLGDEASNAMRTYYDMMDEQLAHVMAERGSIGIAQAIEQQIRAQQGDVETGDDKPETPDANAQHGTAGQKGAIGAQAASLGFVENLWSGRAPAGSTAGLGTGAATSAQPAATTSNIRARAISPGSEQEGFIHALWPHAERAASQLGTRASAIIAVAALETGFGRHVMGDGQGGSSNNLFGIKHHAGEHQAVTHETTEFLHGQPRQVEAEFRRYASVSESVDDFSRFLSTNPRYSQALENAADPQRFADELQRAGYATDPAYANKLRQLIQQIEAHTGEQAPALHRAVSNLWNPT